MKNMSKNLLVAGAVSAFLLGCASTPDTYQELEAARAVVPQVEASPRAGVAATYVADARKALDRANRLADKGAKVDDIKYEANLANLNAAIANEKILAAQAREERGGGSPVVPGHLIGQSGGRRDHVGGSSTAPWRAGRLRELERL